MRATKAFPLTIVMFGSLAGACAPAQAHAEVRAVAHHVTRAAGGHGAVRELCDLLLVASGRYAQLLARAS